MKKTKRVRRKIKRRPRRQPRKEFEVEYDEAMKKGRDALGVPKEAERDMNQFNKGECPTCGFKIPPKRRPPQPQIYPQYPTQLEQPQVPGTFPTEQPIQPEMQPPMMQPPMYEPTTTLTKKQFDQLKHKNWIMGAIAGAVGILIVNWMGWISLC